MKKSGKFYIKRSKGNKWYFILTALNGKILVTSEIYNSLQGARKGIRSVKKNALLADVPVHVHERK